MKFKIHRDHFATGLQQVLNVVGSRATMPILSNVLIQAEGNQLSLTTTNLDLGIRCRIQADVEVPGGITLPVRKLATIVRALPNAEVEFDASSGNQAKITSGGSLFRMMGISEDEFPPLPSFADQHIFNLQQDEIVGMLKNVSYAQSKDENRYILNGVFFQFKENQLTLVATDGRRLALCSKEVEVAEGNAGDLILPAKTVDELQRLLGQGDTVKITFSDRQVAFEIQIAKDDDSGLVDSIYLVSKIVEGKYPDYKQVIPKETENRIKIERELLAECVQRAALVTSDKNNSVKLKLTNNLLEITGSSPEYGDSHESMAISYEAAEVTVAFNPQFLLDPLKALAQDEVYFEFKDELSPGVFKTLDSFLCVIMPLRLN
ncbi:DNA polymerase III subunit beta [Cerasicoccus arenae]|uniref:Beta sliding clamp n=1 Tax=Cerasicoccus arenae TaxID=424488 RepID=A0A8J3D9L7_9BACT|nr:DNA polymerase III subunit beta [Cerasicoccus arenae]MBK1859744.1 DNA polymerase III subunit beta [Cerasicoccus arenae]GHB93557.1 DNA polymerase III subunit beta [Cerasicoccus arenae]